MLKENLEFESLTYETLGNTKERKEHFFKFVESGFPSKKLEDWKFSDLKSIESRYVFFSMSHYVINKLVKQEFF